MRTLKRVGALVAAVAVLFAMTGCKKKAKGHDGAKSAEELVTKVLEVINEDAEYSEVEDWMDWYGWIAFRLMEETDMKCDLSTCKAVVEDLDKDSDYIYEHHRDFVVTWKDANHKNFDDDSLIAWKLYKIQIDEYLKAGGDFILEQFREFAPYDTDFDRDNLHEDKKHDVGYYSIEIDDEDYHAIEIHYYIEDGRYICYGVNFVG